MKRGVTTWAEVDVIHEASRKHARGKRGKQLAIGSKTKSRGKVFLERQTLIASRSGTIGTGVDLSTPDKIVLDSEYVEARNILREANDNASARQRPVAAVHEEVPSG